MLIVAAVLLVSRRLATRDILGLIDWHLLLLFGGLFVVTAALAETGLPADALAVVTGAGIDPRGLAALVPLTLPASNTIGNVPTVVLLLTVLKDLPAQTLYALAALARLPTMSRLPASANIIVVERAKQSDVMLRFAEHTRCGVPMTLISFAATVAWFAYRPLFVS